MNTGITFTKRRKFKRQCAHCGLSFRAADVKAKWCRTCKTQQVPCACGCGAFARSILRPYLAGHAGKTRIPSVLAGREKHNQAIRGNNNPAKRKDVRKKITKGLKRYWHDLPPNERDDRLLSSFRYRQLMTAHKLPSGYRSILEERVAKILTKLKIEFDYEPQHMFDDGRMFFPDFVITLKGHKTLIEVTGYAYDNWRDMFDNKYRKLIGEQFIVVVITYKANINIMKRRLGIKPLSVKGFKCWLLGE